MLATTLAADPFLGRLLTGRIEQRHGPDRADGPGARPRRRARSSASASRSILAFRGLTRLPSSSAEAGDIVSLAGMAKATVADTIADLGRRRGDPGAADRPADDQRDLRHQRLAARRARRRQGAEPGDPRAADARGGVERGDPGQRHAGGRGLRGRRPRRAADGRADREHAPRGLRALGLAAAGALPRGGRPAAGADRGGDGRRRRGVRRRRRRQAQPAQGRARRDAHRRRRQDPDRRARAPRAA